MRLSGLNRTVAVHGILRCCRLSALLRHVRYSRDRSVRQVSVLLRCIIYDDTAGKLPAGRFGGQSPPRTCFCCAFLPAELAKTRNKKETVRGPQAAAAPAGLLSSRMTSMPAR